MNIINVMNKINDVLDRAVNESKLESMYCVQVLQPAISEILNINETPPILCENLTENPQSLGYATVGSAAMDIRADFSPWKTVKGIRPEIKFTNCYWEQDGVVMFPGATIVVPTGKRMAIPAGYELQVRPRSGLSISGIKVANSPGTIDSDYRGEIGIILKNDGTTPFKVITGDRIAQVLLKKVEVMDILVVDELPSTERGAKGFGDSGIK